MTISRRVFVQSGGVALFSLGLDPLFLARAARATRATDRPVLVCVFLRGAVDGLSMVVPHADPRYYRERPRIAIPAKDVVDLDGQFGLHPSLAPLKGLWDNKSLAAFHAVGPPDALRSHRAAQERLNGCSRAAARSRSGRCARSRGSSRREPRPRSPSRTWTDGTRTSTRGRARASSPLGCGNWA